MTSTTESSSKKGVTSSASTPLADFRFPPKSSEDQENEEPDYQYSPSMMPLVSLKLGLQKKASPWTLQSWVKLALTLDGRDKITKVCQYSARMLAWWFIGTHQAKRFKSTQMSLTTSRKAFRLGRSMIEIQKIRDSGLLELFFRPGGPNKKTDPAWQIVGSAMKMIGLMGFWAGDNVNFLTGSGLFDDYREGVSQDQRISHRNALKTKASIFANRFYFFGSVAGLLTALRVYWRFRQTTIREAHQTLVDATERVNETQAGKIEEESNNKQRWKEAREALDQAQEKQFSLFLAVLKGCVDVMVFSNNPGIDLHKKFRGKKNHEGFHCLCGLISASTVLYNNYPNAASKK